MVSSTASSVSVAISFENGSPFVQKGVLRHSWTNEDLAVDEEGEISFTGLEPSIWYRINYTITKDGITVWTIDQKVATEKLVFTNSIPKVTKSGTVIVAAETNLSEDETNIGFEWRKTDSPDDMPSRNGYGAIYGGQMEAVITSLNASSYYRERPFYKSNAGNEYYGEWIAFDPSEFSYCEPTVHTYANTKVEGNEVELTGYVMEGTDEVEEQGFEIWVIIFTDDSKMRKVETKGEVMTVPATGQRMTATLSNLKYGTTYAYRSYVRTNSQTYYGEEITFKTGDDPTGIDGIAIERTDVPHFSKHAVYTLQGVKVSNDATDLKTLPQGVYIINGKKVYVK